MAYLLTETNIEEAYKSLHTWLIYLNQEDTPEERRGHGFHSISGNDLCPVITSFSEMVTLPDIPYKVLRLEFNPETNDVSLYCNDVILNIFSIHAPMGPQWHAVTGTGPRFFCSNRTFRLP